MKLSILIPTVPSRILTTYPKLVNSVLSQIGDRKDVEILALFDNHCRWSGRKRENLLNMAQGTHAVSFDDDDRIADDYISSVMGALNQNPDTDCIVYDILCTINKVTPGILCLYDKDFDGPRYLEKASKHGWGGPPTHNMVYKVSNVINIPWGRDNPKDDWKFAYDAVWAKRAASTIKNQIRINKTLYFYDKDMTKRQEVSTYLDKWGITPVKR